MTNDKAQEAALLPCPFCGSEPECLSVPGGMWVRCPACKALSDDRTAIAAWNRRAPVSALPGEAEVVGLVERLERWRSETVNQWSDEYEPRTSWERQVSDAMNEWYEATTQAATSLQAMQARAEKAEQANIALMDERTSLIETKRQQIEALTRRAEKAERERDALQASHNENAKLRGQRDAALALVEAAEARVKELEGVLEPFAQIAEDEMMIGADDKDEDEWFRWDGSVLTVGDFRRARTALKGGSNG